MDADAHLLIYDGDCDFCRACVRWALRKDTDDRLRPLPLQDEAEREAAGVSRARAERAVVLVDPDGRSRDGAPAVAAVLRLLPGWGWLGRLMDLAPLRPLARVGYRWVADHRGLVSRIVGAPGCDVA